MGRRRRQRRSDELLQGVLLVDKPVDLTSHEVCQRVKSRLRLGKVGHGGTLDPFATGLLPLLINGATRLMTYLQGQGKVYEATIRLGIRTDTMDPTGEVIDTADASGVTEEAVLAALPSFLGTVQQTVPRYAAARVDGKRLYEYARAGEEVELPVKEVEVASFELLEFRPEGATTDLDVRIACGPGTYVRALADDLGQALGCPAHLHALRRTEVEGLSVVGAVPLAAIEEQAETWRQERQALQDQDGGHILRFVPEDNARRWRDHFGDCLVPVSTLLGGLPTLRLPAELIERVQSGQPMRKGELERVEGAAQLEFSPGDRLVLEDLDGLRGVAIVRATCAHAALARHTASAVVMEVERVLR